MEDQLIIDSPKSVPAWVRIRDGVLTGLLWLLYFYLIREAFFFLERLLFGSSHSESAALPYTFLTLGWYALAIVISGVVFIGWARYSQFRFRGHERRHFSYQVSADDLGDLYGIRPQEITAWQDARILTMRHDADGNLLEVFVVMD